MNFNGDLADRIIESYGLTGPICLHIPQLKERFLDMYKTATSTIGTNAICDKAAEFFLKTAQNLAKSLRKEAPYRLPKKEAPEFRGFFMMPVKQRISLIFMFELFNHPILS